MLTALSEGAPSPTSTGFSADPQRPSPLLAGLVSGLRELVKGQDQPPVLILAGDILDLALSPDETALMIYRLFAHLAFDDGPPVFDPVVHYVPGNHDHHEWEMSRESQYVTYVCAQPPQAPLDAPWHTTKLSPAAERPTASSALLTGLTRVQAGGTERDRGPGLLPEPGAAQPGRPPQPRRQPRALHRVDLLADVPAARHPVPGPARDRAGGHRAAGGGELRLDRLLLVHAGALGPGGRGHGADLRRPGQRAGRRRVRVQPDLGAADQGQGPDLAPSGGEAGAERHLPPRGQPGRPQRARHPLGDADRRRPVRAARVPGGPGPRPAAAGVG